MSSKGIYRIEGAVLDSRTFADTPAQVDFRSHLEGPLTHILLGTVL